MPLKTKDMAKAVANAPKEIVTGLSRELPWQTARSDAPVLVGGKARVALGDSTY